MTVTADEVAAAQKAADDAAAASKAAHEKAEAAEKAATAARAKATADRKAATEAAPKVKPLQDEASRLEGEAEVSRQQCEAAGPAVKSAKTAAAKEEARAQAIQARHPGECTSETEAAAERARLARERADSAEARQTAACDKAKADKKAAEDKRAEAVAAQKEAERLDTEAHGSETAADTAETDLAGPRGEAMVAAMKAVAAGLAASSKAEELKGQANAAPPPTPRPPNVGDTSNLGCVPTPPPTPGGCSTDSKANVVREVKGSIIHLFGADESKTVRGRLFEVTLGTKCTNVAGGEVSTVMGGRFDVVIGLETKLAALGDYRTILGFRWERNVGFKFESVKGDVFETIISGQRQHVPTVNSTIQVTRQLDTSPQMEDKVGKLVEQHKGKLADMRKAVKESYQQALEHYDTVKTRITEYTEDTNKIKEKVQDLIIRSSTLKTEAKKYQMKSDAFIKILVDGTRKVKAGKYKESINGQYVLCADAIARLKGEVKWN